MKQIIKLFKENGYQLYQVGGSVRDELLGSEPNDIDLATDATPEQMIKMYNRWFILQAKEFAMLNPDTINMIYSLQIWYSENGIKHGTIILIENNIDYEITTFRKDVSTDGRNATVEFAKTIEEDLARRDFCLNAIAVNAYTGEIINPFTGQQDIKDKVIRFVGEPLQRIREDYLRLFRVYRFLSQLGKGWKFVNNEDVSKCLIGELDMLSKERIRDEVIKIFKHNPCFALYHMPEWLIMYIFHDILAPQVNQEFHGHFHAEDIRQHLMNTLSNSCRLTSNPLLRLACFLHDVGKCMEVEVNEWGYPTFPKHDTLGAERVEIWMKNMKFSNEEIHYVTQLIRHHMVNNHLFEQDKPQNRAIKRYVMALGEELLDDMILLNYCDRAGNLANTKLCSYEEYLQKHTIKPMWLEIKAKDTAFKVTDLKINGIDCMALGLQGKQIGDILKKIFEEVDSGLLVNERETLLKRMREIK